jgi:hypothetical protein
MTPQENEILQLRHDLFAAETEIGELRRKLLDELLEYARLDRITVSDLIRVMEGMK